MKIVIDIDDSHMPFVRQQADLHGPEVRLDFPHFMAQIPATVVGLARSAGGVTDGYGGTVARYEITPLDRR